MFIMLYLVQDIWTVCNGDCLRDISGTGDHFEMRISTNFGILENYMFVHACIDSILRKNFNSNIEYFEHQPVLRWYWYD